MKPHVLVGEAFLAGAVVALVVVWVMAYIGGGLGGPQHERALVQHGVQSVTICDEHDTHIMMDRIAMVIPGSDVCLCGPEKKSECHVWYHYADSEE